jgi:hypothetical protein
VSTMDGPPVFLEPVFGVVDNVRIQSCTRMLTKDLSFWQTCLPARPIPRRQSTSTCEHRPGTSTGTS